MRMPTIMSHQFSQVPSADIPRSMFNRDSGYKTTFDAGLLIPFFRDEVLPGDTFTLNATAFARLATPLKPIMDNMRMSTFFFFVPNRLIWDNWERFNGAQDNPDDTTDYVVPTMTSTAGTGYLPITLHDYFGLPTQVTQMTHISLYHRAYNLIWNEWFRDENLQDSVVVDKDDGPDNEADYVLLRRGKRHDYFTSCLPWPQKGPSVELPLGSTAPVLGIGMANQTYFTGGSGTVYESDGTTSTYADWKNVDPSTADGVVRIERNATTNFPNIRADLSQATASTINALRLAFQVQRLYERDARGGTRYIEILKAHFGVTSPDARLQRPEYLGGGVTDVNVTPIAQTNASGVDTTPQGNLAAMGTASFGGHGFSKSFVEHGVVIGLVCVDADLTYQQGLERIFSRSTRFDYYWPALSHIGEQAVLNKEIFVEGGGDPENEEVFGYQEAYAEYRYKPSLITGEFRSNYTTSLDFWHLSEEFATRPVLNDEFIVSNPPVDRVIAVSSEPHFIFDAVVRLKCARPMPVYGVPGLIDHF